MNHKNAHILKLLAHGLTPEQVVKKLGYQDLKTGLARVQQAFQGIAGKSKSTRGCKPTEEE